MSRFRREAKQHETLNFQINSSIGEENWDFRPGDRVMTCDGLPGKITAVSSGLYGADDYEVTLDNGMGGGSYRLSDISKVRGHEASIHEAVEVYASIPVEATTEHTADHDYPELGTILYDRLPNENVKTAANYNKAEKPESSMEDSTQKIDPDDEVKEEPEDDEDAEAEAQDQKAVTDDEPQPESVQEQAVNNLPEVDPPSACSFCGHPEFEEPTMTGRGARAKCLQCGGTMKSWGGQWEPEFPNSSQNQQSAQWDYRSGGPGGVAQAPGVDYKSASLQKEASKATAGIVNYVVDKVYNRIQERNELAHLKNDIAERVFGFTGPYSGPTQYAQYCQQCGQNHVLPNQFPNGINSGMGGGLGSRATKTTSELSDGEWHWHFTATWMDVQAKARRIRREGHVKIVVASNLYVSGEVQGDHNVYESQLNYIPGTKKVADWACGCKWASYSWGRSPQYKRFEGRLCSHALALQYEANSRGMFGKEVKEDLWHSPDRPIVVQHERHTKDDLTRYSSLDSDGIYEAPELLDLKHAPIYALLSESVGKQPFEDTIEVLASFNVDREVARDMAIDVVAGLDVTAWLVEEKKKKPVNVNYAPGAIPFADGCEAHGDVNCDTCSDGNASISTMAMRFIADYSAGDPLSSIDQSYYSAPTPSSHSQNPASTGWATSQDPGDWGRSLISNNFGLTVDAVQHEAMGQAGPDYDNLTFSHHAEPTPDKFLAEDYPEEHSIIAHHPEHGPVGELKYWHNPEENTVMIANRVTHSDHQRRGVADRIQEQFAKLHGGALVDPGIRTNDGKAWADHAHGPRSSTTIDDGMHEGHTYVAKKSDDPTNVAGVALRANDTGRVLMIQRSNKDEKDPARGTWEFPGGHHEDGDKSSLHAGVREWEEEVGQPFPEGGSVASTWRSGPYRGHVVHVPSEDSVDLSKGRSEINPDDPDGDDHEPAAWWDVDHAKSNPALRKELNGAPWDDIAKAATLHEGPEAALPFTDGANEDQPTSTFAGNTGGSAMDSSLPDASSDAIRLSFLQTAAAKSLMADLGISKAAMKDFNYAEQQELINEGQGARMRNFGDLQITGTHYEHINDDIDEGDLFI